MLTLQEYRAQQTHRLAVDKYNRERRRRFAECLEAISELYSNAPEPQQSAYTLDPKNFE